MPLSEQDLKDIELQYINRKYAPVNLVFKLIKEIRELQSQQTFYFDETIEVKNAAPKPSDEVVNLLKSLDVEKGVHAAHCCQDHGCKYNDPNCPIVKRKVKQKYLCEDCKLTGE